MHLKKDFKNFFWKVNREGAIELLVSLKLIVVDSFKFYGPVVHFVV